MHRIHPILPPLLHDPFPPTRANHAYWNFAGEGSDFIGGHILTIHSNYYTLIDNLLIPAGEIRSVARIPLDFRRLKAAETEMKKAGGNLAGYDHNFVLNKSEFALWRWRPL